MRPRLARMGVRLLVLSSLLPMALPEGITAAQEGEILWHNAFSDAICQTTRIALPVASLAAGTCLNPPQEAELIPLEGDGTPSWVYPGTDFRVAASRYSDVMAGVDRLPTSVVLYKWNAGSAVPDWSFPVASAAVMGPRSVVVSPDGSTIALLATMQSPQVARLYCFAADSPEPLGTYDTPQYVTSGNLDITADGAYIAFHAGAIAYVFDRDAAALRWSGSMGAGNDPLALSGNGSYLAYGWTSLVVREWSGSAYNVIWSVPGGSFWLRSCRFSLDEGTLVAGWYDHNTHLQNRVQLYRPSSSSPLWTYDYQFGSGGYQDIPSEIAVTSTGGHIAVASWGDQANTNPEIHVFEHGSPTPILTVDTPGSMFDIDIAEDADGPVYVAACGKHIHANENGRGGDLYSIRLRDPAGVSIGLARAGQPTIRVSPNPFRGTTRFYVDSPLTERAVLRVYTALGRVVRTFEIGTYGGLRSLEWDGRSAQGWPVEPGCYFLRVEAGGRAAEGRVLRIE